MNKAGLALLYALVTTPAAAVEPPETWGLHLATAHARGGYNDVNPGFYLRWNSGLTLGAYRNSERRNSAYVGWTFSDDQDRIALTVGAVTGYRGGTIPLVVPSVRIPIAHQVSARLSLLAPPEKGTTAVHLSIEWRCCR
jgi:hypothetical protein